MFNETLILNGVRVWSERFPGLIIMRPTCLLKRRFFPEDSLRLILPLFFLLIFGHSLCSLIERSIYRVYKTYFVQTFWYNKYSPLI